MKIFKRKKDLQYYLKDDINKGSIGFVPTMGALHKGHISLIKNCKKNNKICICSIFVNPLQFNNLKDYDNYPNNIESDIDQLYKAGVDILFLPNVKEMYGDLKDPDIEKNKYDFSAFEKVLEGKYRPGHFKGVALVVSKLLKIVQPDNLYLGQKDYQQYLIICELVKKERFLTKITLCPIVREANGLAMSSRNERLSPVDRKNAGKIYKVLSSFKKAKKKSSLINPKKTQQAIDELKKIPHSRLEYFSIVDAKDLTEISIKSKAKKILVCVAIYLGEVRLIDNILLSLK